MNTLYKPQSSTCALVLVFSLSPLESFFLVTRIFQQL